MTTYKERCETCIHAKIFGGENDNRRGAKMYANDKDIYVPNKGE